jgi:tRNA threonylcarbamoyladenosine biosynthesis protein TsaB
VEVKAEIHEDQSRKFSAVRLVDLALKAAGLRPAQIERLAIGLGPGSYTGIRSAIALAQGWQLARPVHVVAVPSVDALAQRATRMGQTGRLMVVVDAQRGDLYLAQYTLTDQGFTRLQPIALIPAAELESLSKDALIVGPEATRWGERATNLFPDAADVGRIACQSSDFISAEEIEPIYLRETTFVKANRSDTPH